MSHLGLHSLEGGTTDWQVATVHSYLPSLPMALL